MLGTIDPGKRAVEIIGGGFAGLLMAQRLIRRGYEVSLTEASPRLGGLIRTEQTEWGIAERAAHSFLASPPVRELCRELQVELLEVRRDSRARFVFRDGRPRRMPLSVRELLVAAARAYLVWAPRGVEPSELDLETWALRHFGRGALEYGLSPFLRGIFGAEPGELIVGAAFPNLVVPTGHSFFSSRLAKVRAARQSGRSTRRPPAPMMAPKYGMGSLTDALAREVEGAIGPRLRLNTRVGRLPEGDDRNVILCVPADRAAELLRAREPGLSRALAAIPYTPLVSATVFFARHALPKPVRGVGVLMPRREKRAALGILFNSSSFAERVVDEAGHVSFTVMIGGSANPSAIGLSDGELRELITQETREVLGARDEPLEIRIARWPRAIPQYGRAALDAWRLARETWGKDPGRVLFANYTGQVSLRAMIESTASLPECRARGA